MRAGRYTYNWTGSAYEVWVGGRLYLIQPPSDGLPFRILSRAAPFYVDHFLGFAESQGKAEIFLRSEVERAWESILSFWDWA